MLRRSSITNSVVLPRRTLWLRRGAIGPQRVPRHLGPVGVPAVPTGPRTLGSISPYALRCEERCKLFQIVTKSPIAFIKIGQHWKDEQENGRRNRERANCGGRIRSSGRSPVEGSVDVNDDYHHWTSDATRNGNMALRDKRNEIW